MKVKDFGNTEGLIVDLVLPIADELGYDLWDVRYEKEGAAWYLRIFIDKEDGITIDDAVRMTEPVNELLDEKDPIKESYTLEVGSPGLERKLTRDFHFEACLGMDVTISKIHAAKGEEKEVTGKLESYNPETQTIIVDGQEYPLEKLSYVKLYEEIEF